MGQGRDELVRTLQGVAGENLRTVVVERGGDLDLLFAREDIRPRTKTDRFRADVKTLRRVAAAQDDLAEMRTVGDYRGNVALFEDCLVVFLYGGPDRTLGITLDIDASPRLDEFVARCGEAFERFEGTGE